MSNLVYEGPVDPTITGSLGNIFKYKGFTLNVFMTYSFGNVVRLDPIFSNSYSDLTAMPRNSPTATSIPATNGGPMSRSSPARARTTTSPTSTLPTAPTITRMSGLPRAISSA